MDIWLILIMIPVLLLVGVAIAITSIEEYHNNILDLKEMLTEAPPYPQKVIPVYGEEAEEDLEENNTAALSSPNQEEKSEYTKSLENTLEIRNMIPNIEKGLLPIPHASDIEGRRKFFLALQAKKDLEKQAQNLETTKQEILREQEKVTQDKNDLTVAKQIKAMDNQLSQQKALLQKEQIKNQATSSDMARERLKATKAQHDKTEAVKMQEKLQSYNDSLEQEKESLTEAKRLTDRKLLYSNNVNKKLRDMLKEEQTKQKTNHKK